MKRVLIITYYWPPSGGSGVQRWVKFCKYLPSCGWQPVIYAPLDPQYDSIDKTFEEEIPREAEVIRRHISEPYGIYKRLMGKEGVTDMKSLTAGASSDIINPINKGRKSFRQRLSLFIRANFFIPDPRCWWVRPSVRFLKKYLKEHPVDAIVTTGPPQSMHLIGLRLSKAVNLPWIADFRDPWTKMYYYKNLPLTRRADARQHEMEKEVLDNATAVLTVTPFMQADFAAMTSTPIEVITNGYDENDFNQIVESDGNFNITHTGLFSSDGNPEVLWSVLAEKCSRDPEFKKMLRIRFIGRTDDAIVSSVARAGLKDNLLNFGYKSHSTAVKEQKSSSMLILPLRNDPDYKLILPGKLFEYLASGKPILGIGQEDGAAADVLRETKAGVMCGWSDSSSISRYIDTCWMRFKSGETDAVSDKISLYSRRNLTGRLAELLNSITEKHE